MIFKGFRFGMLLQLAIGPMCLLVFNTSANSGLPNGLVLMSAIALTDLLFILLSALGVGALLQKKKVSAFIKIFGAVVLIVFGLNMLVSAFDISIIPSINIFKHVRPHSIFLEGIILTASNPLTIVFWSGVFSSQVAANGYSAKQLKYFSSGCVLATITFMSAVAVIGTLFKSFLSQTFIDILNVCVGIVIIIYGIKMLFKKDKNKTA